MKMIKKWLIVWLIVIIISINWLIKAPPAVYACSCMPPAPPQEALAEATAVFAGQVMAVEVSEGPVNSSADPVQATFDVSQVWKGDITKSVTLTTPRESASCGFNFEVGREYIVYAWDDGDGLSTNLCSRTAELAPDLEDLDALGPGAAPVEAAGGQIAYGLNIPSWVIYGLLLLVATGIAIALIIFYRRRRAR